jgi:hypothetical protein
MASAAAAPNSGRRETSRLREVRARRLRRLVEPWRRRAFRSRPALHYSSFLPVLPRSAFCSRGYTGVKGGVNGARHAWVAQAAAPIAAPKQTWRFRSGQTVSRGPVDRFTYVNFGASLTWKVVPKARTADDLRNACPMRRVRRRASSRRQCALSTRVAGLSRSRITAER